MSKEKQKQGDTTQVPIAREEEGYFPWLDTSVTLPTSFRRLCTAVLSLPSIAASEAASLLAARSAPTCIGYCPVYCPIYKHALYISMDWT